MSRAAAYLLRALIFALLLPGLAWAQEVADEGPDGAGGEFAAPMLEDPDMSPAERLSVSERIVEQSQLPSDAPDYEAWARAALRAEQAIEAGRASDQALGALRRTIVDWRDQFADARSENRVPIATLKNQIAALGEPPAEGRSESETIAAQRERLNEQLAEFERPVIAAQLAYARADTIISEIDDLLRERQADELLSTGPSPLNPSHWSDAASALSGSFANWTKEIRQNLESDAQRRAMRNRLPATILFATLAFALIFGGRRLSVTLGARMTRRGTGPALGVWLFLISLGEVLFPALGLVLMLIAVDASQVLGATSETAVNAFISAWINVIVARWIGARVFGRDERQWELLNLTPASRIEGRIESVLLGFAYGLHVLLQAVIASETYAAEVATVLELPVVVFTGVVLMRVGRLLRAHAKKEGEESEEGRSFRDVLLSLGGQAVVLVGIIGIVMAALSYGALADFLVYNTALTLALVGVLLIVHVFFVDLYGALTKSSIEDAQQALLPVLGSLIVFILSLPVLALIWGVREAELSELWTRMGQGIAFGEDRVTPSDLLMILVIFALGFGATRLIQGMLKTTVLPKTKMDIGGRNAITSGIGYVGYFLAGVIAITSVGINLSSLAVVAGALSVGIGFGLQTIVSNFVSGIILLIERPISEGDWIDAGGQMGIVKDISVRSTTIQTFDKTDVVVPNSDLISGVVTNYTRGNRVGRLVLDIGVAYGTDTKRVSQILMEITEAHPLVAVNPPPQVGFMNFGADALEFQIRAILSDVFYILVVRDEINHEIARRFKEEGIEIPFAQRDIWLRNPEALYPPRPESSAETAPEAASERPKPTQRELEAEDDADPDGVDGDGDTS